MPKKSVIAIVDDDQAVREGTRDLLTAVGFVANAFERADEFLQSNHLDETSCLITDVRMPGMNGFELLNHLARSGHSIPTILMTAFPNDRGRTRATKAGVVCYLKKPFKEGELMACIHSALGSSQSGAREP
jgi:FixJ family two-component response regulator